MAPVQVIILSMSSSNLVLVRLPRRRGQRWEEKRKVEDDGKVEWQIEVQRSVGLDRGDAR